MHITAPSRRLAPSAGPIAAIRIYASSGDDAALKGAAAERFSEILQANGLAVAGFTPLERPLPDLAALERRWFAATPATGVTHALVLTRQTAHTFTTNHVAEHYLRYEVALWEAQSRRLVRTGLLASHQRPTPERRAEAMLRGKRSARTWIGNVRNPGSQLVYWMLPDLGRLVNERAPPVLAANGLDGRCTVLPLQATPADRERALATPNRPTLVLHVASVSVSSVIRSHLPPNRGEANVQYKVLGTAAPVAPPTSLSFKLGAHPAWGALKIQKIDADWVDEMLMQALDQAARQGAVRLPAGKAVKPKS